MLSHSHFTRAAGAALAGASLLMASMAWAADSGLGLQAGLWRISNKLASADAQNDQTIAALMNQLGNLPPAQRQQLEALAAQHGTAMPTIEPGGAISVTSCITPEMAARQQIPTGQPGDCSSNNVPVAGGLRMAFTCKSPQSSGTGMLRYSGDRAFTMTMDVVTSARGAPEQVSVSSTGKWLGASCPAAAAPK